MSVGESNTGNPALFHTLPMCQEFNAIDSSEEMLDYMRRCTALRDARELHPLTSEGSGDSGSS